MDSYNIYKGTKIMARHSFHSDDRSPLAQVVEYIEQHPDLSLQAEIERMYFIFHYPYALLQMGAPPKQVSLQAEISIRHLRQEIASLKALLKSLSPALEREDQAKSNGFNEEVI